MKLFLLGAWLILVLTLRQWVNSSAGYPTKPLAEYPKLIVTNAPDYCAVHKINHRH
jgi:hypothetical protein